MASSKGPSGRPSSSKREVERTLSDSSVGNVMPCSGAQAASGDRKGKGKAVAVLDREDEDDDIIIVEWSAGPAAHSSQRKQSASSASGRATGSTSSHSRPSMQRPTPASPSSSRTLDKSTQPKRKVISSQPGDGFKMDFKHTQAIRQQRATTPASTSSSKDQSRTSQSRTAPTSSRANASTTSETSATATSRPIPSLPPAEAAFTALLPPSLAGPSRSKPLCTLPPPPPPSAHSAPSRTLSFVSWPSIAAPRTPAAQPARRAPSPPLFSSAHKATVFDSPSPVKRALTRRSSSPLPPPPTRAFISHAAADTLRSTDWAELHPSLVASLLFRVEYALHGGLTWEQTKMQGEKKEETRQKRDFRPVQRKPIMPGPRTVQAEPSWARDEQAVNALKRKLGERDHFVAVMWAKDFLGVNKRIDGWVEEKGALRRTILGGADMYLLGKEFPLKFVMIVGVVVGAVEGKNSQGGYDRVNYEVDDGTGVVTCVCMNREPQVAQLPPKPKLDDRGQPRTPSPRKRKVAEVLETMDEDRIEVGSLVRVVGEVEEHFAVGGDRKIKVEKMEVLNDFNLEAEHHLHVAQLHREVYSQPFDLQGRLAEIKEDEASRWQGIPASQASSSAAGSPKKNRFRYPIKLDIADITFPNFIAYLRKHIRDHHVDFLYPNSSQTSTSPASSPDSRGGGRSSREDLDERPQPFTLDDLEGDRHLAKFGERLAQKLEAQKRAAGVASDGAKGRKKAAVYVNRQGQDEFVSVKGVGSRGGSALLLPTVSSGARSSKRARTEGGVEKVEETPLKGDRLAQAVSKQFRLALIEMRKRGVILLREPVGQQSMEDEDGDDDDGQNDLPDMPHYGFDKYGNKVDVHSRRERPPSPVSSPDTVKAEPRSSPTTPRRPSDKRPPKGVSPPTFGLPSFMAQSSPRVKVSPSSPAAVDRSFLSNTSWSSSVAEVEGETYELVTCTTVAARVLSALRNACGSRKFDDPARRKDAEGFTVREVREMLRLDERWEGVAVYSEIVEKALMRLEDQDEVRRVGRTEGVWMPTKGLGFGKGRW